VTRPYIGVVGSSEGTPVQRELAREVGTRLARAGAIVVCGGLSGVMEAVCVGAKEGGGLTIGILPGSERHAANPHVDVALATGLGELRNGLIVRFSDALIAVGGGWGTLSEIAFAMRTGRPVVALAGWEETLDGRSAHLVSGEAKLRRAEDPQGAVDIAISAAGAPGRSSEGS
jgi:uncharacterized protein (TIGR00725 family)